MRGVTVVADERDPIATGVLPSYGRYHALLIGVNEYKTAAGSPYGPLKGPANDIRLLEDKLRGRLDFEVTTLVDGEVTKQAIVDRLTRYAQEFKKGDGQRDLGDNLLVWYAGHGEQDKEEPWNWRWVMPDGATMLSFREIRALLRRVPANHILLISDSCFAGGMKPDSGYTRRNPAERIRAARARSFQIASSGDAVSVQDVFKDGSSPFARAFVQELEGLGRESEPVSAWEILGRVRRTVDDLNNMEPVFGYDDEKEGGFGPAPDQGEFFFVHPDFLRIESAKSRYLGEYSMRRTVRDRLQFVDKQYGFARYRLRDSPDTHALMVPVGGAQVPVDGRERDVRVAPFLIDANEVSVRQFREFLEANGSRMSTRYQSLQGYGEDDAPVVGVTLQQARAYATWARKSLPTEAEWFAAAAVKFAPRRGNAEPEGRIFAKPWHFRADARDPELAWLAFPPARTKDELDVSCWGVERMATGVREWCLTVEGDPQVGVIRGGTVVRASSRDRLAEELPASMRRVRADVPRNNVGFRCVLRDISE